MRTLEISARLLAPPHIPRAAVSPSLRLPTLHFPSAKFGERDPPPGRVCLGQEHALFYFIAARGAGRAREETGARRVRGDFSGGAFGQAAPVIRSTRREDFIFKAVMLDGSRWGMTALRAARLTYATSLVVPLPLSVGPFAPQTLALEGKGASRPC